MRYGLFLNAGQQLGGTDTEIFDTVLEEARLAEQSGYHDVWLTEHHFIPCGVNSSALTLAAFLLGRTQRLRVGTAVTLSPLYHPVQLAEQVAILDQCSGGRLDLGIGRGGYLRDFEVFGIDPARWDDEPEATARVLLDAWRGDTITEGGRESTFTPTSVRPRPSSAPHPPLFIASSTSAGVRFAAQNGLALQHYFGTPVAARVKTEALYAAAAREAGQAVPDHLHTLPLMVTDGEEGAARALLLESLTESFRQGDHPSVPQAANRHVGPDGKPAGREALAALVARDAVIGPPDSVAQALADFIRLTGARRIAFYMEPLRDRQAILASVRRFIEEVRPRMERLLKTA